MKKILSVLACATVVSLAACQQPTNSTTDADTQNQEPIKIGYIGPLTGDAAAYGADTINGMRLKVSEINEAGGIDGRQIEIIAEDGRCNGADAASAGQKLIHVNKVIAIVGGQCSGETLAVAPIANPAKVVMVSPISSSPDVSNAGEYVFRVFPSDALKTKAMANYFAEKNWTRIAIITENTDFTSAFRSSLIENAGEDNIVFDEVDEPGTKDIRTLLTRLQDIEFDVFVVNAQSDAVGAAMVQQFREQGFTEAIIGHDVLDSENIAKLAGDAAEGALTINVPSAGEGGDFEKRLTEEFGDVSIIPFAAHSYDAAGVLLHAIAEAGTDGAAIQAYLAGMKSYDGLVGTFSFNEDGDVLGIPYEVKQFKNGKIVKVQDISVD